MSDRTRRVEPLAPIIVMGMHRSGTTLLTKLLEDFGVFTGRRGGSNHEARLFKHANKWIFAQLGTTSHHPDQAAFARVARLQPHLDRVMGKQVRGVGAARYLGLQGALRYRDLRNVDFPWAWKDPRNSFTAGLWKRLFPNAKILHIYRHPIDVADSLRRREEARLARFDLTLRARLSESVLLRKPLYCRSVRLLDTLEGVDLWQQYVEASFRSCEPFERDTMHCRYETLLASPAQTLGELTEFLGLRVDETQMSRAIAQVNPERGFAHRVDPSTAALASEIADLPLVRKLDYHVPCASPDSEQELALEPLSLGRSRRKTWAGALLGAGDRVARAGR